MLEVPNATSKLLRSSFLIWFMSLITISLILISGVAAEPEIATLPRRTLSDQWTYSLDFNQPNAINGTLKMQVTNTSITVNGYNCTEITGTARGVVSGNATAWTINSKEYDVKTDYSVAKTYASLESSSSFGGNVVLMALESDNSFSSSAETDYNPPLEFGKGFPLFVGENWIAQTSENTTSSMTIMGSTTHDNYVQKTTTNFTVQRMDDTKVAAGEFQTYVIEANKSDGSSREMYYSPIAQMQVKELDYDSKGNLTTTSALLDYSLSGSGGSSTLLEIVASVVGITLLGLVATEIFLVRRSRKLHFDRINSTSNTNTEKVDNRENYCSQE